MANYEKSQPLTGKWVKGSEVKSGTKCKLVSEVQPVESQFKKQDGSPKTQDVGKVRFEGAAESLNISLNRATLNALVDAFGKDSKNWVGRELTAETEKVVVSGKRVTAVYLIPDGYELGEDANGYVMIQKVGSGEIVAGDVPEEEDDIA